MTVYYTQKQEKEGKKIITLLARSDQWGNFVGSDEATKWIDTLILSGDPMGARIYLYQVTSDLPHHLARAATEARKDHLDLLDSEPRFPAKPQLTNPVTSS